MSTDSCYGSTTIQLAAHCIDRANHVEVTAKVLCSMLVADTIELSANAELTVNPNYPVSE
ncbi:MAG: hypothetical protein DRP52_02810 [Planctomycetota bacterium]|nr:MAG: hypothetical protein DRP52_02810 [Planctomycetota bacterium]